jgi:hypothetical protein
VRHRRAGIDVDADRSEPLKDYVIDEYLVNALITIN